jgi:hypothetical protein
MKGRVDDETAGLEVEQDELIIDPKKESTSRYLSFVRL